LSFQEMQINKQPFPINMIVLNENKILVWPNAVDKNKGKIVVISNPRVLNEDKSVLSREVVAEKTPDGGETLKIPNRNEDTRGQTRSDHR
jgi:hypothetical protein